MGEGFIEEVGKGGDCEFILGVFLELLFVIVIGGRFLRFIVDFIFVLVGVGIKRNVLLEFFFKRNFFFDLIGLSKVVKYVNNEINMMIV